MECNKDEALRAKELAETKLLQKEIVGAQKFAIKAQNLFPALKGLSQLIATVDGSAKKRRVDEHKPNSTMELSQSETRDMLIVKARKEILKNLVKWDSDSKKQVKRVQKDNVDTKKDEVSGVRKEEEVNHLSQPKHSPMPSVVDLDEEPPVFMSMAVPDPDFHDFDRDRREKSFGQDEVWAVYDDDDDDGMPRMYAFIHRLKSSRPFRVKMRLLNSKSNTELSEPHELGWLWFSQDLWKISYTRLFRTRRNPPVKLHH